MSRWLKNKYKLAMISSIFLANVVCADSLNWTGFYAGPKIGVAFNHIDLNAHHIGLINFDGNYHDKANYSSFFAGAQLGYNYDLNAKFTLSVEGDYINSAKKLVSLNNICSLDTDVIDHFSFKNYYQGSIRGRLIYKPDDYSLSPFIMGGGSFVHLGLKYNNENNDYYTKKSTESGWLLGAGVEKRIFNNWSLRAEYYYSDYNSLRMKLPSIYNLLDSHGKAQVKLHTNALAASINYIFN